MKKLTFTLLFALMAIVSAQAAKVYLKIGEGRVTAESNLAVWVWEGKNNFCTNGWPGDKLTEKETIKAQIILYIPSIQMDCITSFLIITKAVELSKQKILKA